MNWLDYQNIYWKKYLYLESRVIETDYYVTISKENFKTFSNVYEELLVSICSELESVFREWSREMNNDSNINSYVNKIIFKNEDNFDKEVSVFLCNLKVKPFSDLTLFLREINELKYINTKKSLN